ncbi:hypothetical protein MPTK1_3g11330 [Marchantia polymorpha subsp. ruderalis]|uniref:BTB domain-containing protein n=2 Tax=Marchantia polymorpha TaxID=3197 RepID=A0A176VSA7_MARPO|nr:hypothetical protein AXG93_1630s1160 [Marchantia polymorpha subsp. ruderalis]PTQ40885.1 hypothetical protein MARPO_0037s0064 [Marchantia polymorpha]BBN05220.1 hypothetical protein Mp_3g11330 [Marchantia polymorpha subsp. ruderalis]|eukprot:PTQ40885.1 hypothetical protein MARPO_0037s0064 [Marchantia polymorpha]
MKAALPQAMVEGKQTLASSSVEASAALCEHVQRQGLDNHLFSDITLSFCGKDHQLHRIILSQSSYFHSLLSGPWREHGKSRIELQIDDPNVTPEGLEIAFAYMYGMSPVFTPDNVISVLAAGCFLCLENLCEKGVQFIVEDLKVETFVGYQQLSERHCYGRFADAIRNACWTFLCTHASRELLHLLPKFSLQVLCLLLKSDELWVPSESERYKLAKQALIEWKLARVKATNVTSDCTNTRKPRTKPSSARKSARNSSSAPGTRSKNSLQKTTRLSVKERGAKKKETTAPVVEPVEPVSPPKEEVVDTDLRKLQRLWEADDPLDRNKEDTFQKVAELFTDGGIIFAHMEADEVLQAKKELEDAGLPNDAANDSMWQGVLLKFSVLKFRETHNLLDESSEDEDDEEMDDDEDDDDDDDEADDEDDDEASDRDSSDSDGWSTDRSSQEADDESNSSDARGRDGIAGTGQACKRLKTHSTTIVCFACSDSVGQPDSLGAGGDGKRRRTTGGFTWAIKPDVGMQLADFPPFRFGAEFTLKDKRWTPSADLKSREVFYGGSMWKIVGSNLNQDKEEWQFGVHCRPLDTWEPHTYQDNRKRVPFSAKLYIKTCQGLRCVSGNAVRKMRHHASHMRHSVSMHLSKKDIVENEPLRVSAVVQLMDD